MNRSGSLIAQLFSIRNRYGIEFSSQKLKLLDALGTSTLTSLPVRQAGQKALQTYHHTLLFLIAYPDNKAIYKLANESLQQLQLYIRSHGKIKDRLYNSGITNTQLCAAFSFEIVKWMRSKHPGDIRLSSFEADDGMIQSILSVVMPKVESEILQDGNADWRTWLNRRADPDSYRDRSGKGSEQSSDILDRLIAVFDETDIRPEVKDELWGALGVSTEIDFPLHDHLPGSLFTPYFHRSLIKKNFTRQALVKPIRVKLDETEAERIIECSRMILLRHLREIDPITFTAAKFVSYYLLPRGLSVALMGMVPERRHPIDSYMGYAVFKNGLPVGYAGSWILFDSGRIGFNVFPSYRGGESQYIFQQVLNLHRIAYKLKRFSVDPYQVGKHNSDGIHSGAFWVYYHAGFRPIRKDQQELAEAEALKIRSNKGYRSPWSILKKLADSRSELILQKNAVRFDVTDLSLSYASILKEQYNNKRKPAEERCFIKLVEWLKLKNYHQEKMKFILKNWAILLFSREPDLRRNSGLKKILKKLFELKASGAEEDYIIEMQRAGELRNFLEQLLVE